MKEQRGNRLKHYYFFNLSTRTGWLYSTTSRALYPQEKAPLRIEQEAGWTSSLLAPFRSKSLCTD